MTPAGPWQLDDDPFEPVAPDTERVGDLISSFVADAAAGQILDPDGQPYTRESLRELRAALAHVDSALGDMPVEDVSRRHIAAMMDHLAATGLSPARLDAVAQALDRVWGGAVVPPPVAAPPAPAAPAAASASPASDARPRPQRRGPAYDPRPQPRAQTPTFELLAAADSVAHWTVRAIVVVFVLALALLILAF